MIEFIRSHNKTKLHPNDKIYLMPPYDNLPQTVVGALDRGNHILELPTNLSDVGRVEIEHPYTQYIIDNTLDIDIREVFFKKADRDVAIEAVKAVSQVYNSKKGYETTRRKWRIQKRRASISIKMLDPLPLYTQRAMASVCAYTMGATYNTPYCFVIESYPDKDDSRQFFGDIKFVFDPAHLPNPQLNVVYLRKPHGFGVVSPLGTVVPAITEGHMSAFMGFLNQCGFKYYRADMAQILPGVAYYSRKYSGNKKHTE